MKITGKTFGEVYRPAMLITDQAEADEYKGALVKHLLAFPNVKTEDEAISLMKQNLGYIAGYYGNETRERVERLFNCEHPVFGKESGDVPTPKEAFEMVVKQRLHTHSPPGLPLGRGAVA